MPDYTPTDSQAWTPKIGSLMRDRSSSNVVMIKSCTDLRVYYEGYNQTGVVLRTHLPECFDPIPDNESSGDTRMDALGVEANVAEDVSSIWGRLTGWFPHG